MSQYRLINSVDSDGSQKSDGESADDIYSHYDPSVYQMLEFIHLDNPCLSFDFIRGPVYEQELTSEDELLHLYLVAGSQAPDAKNSLTVVHVTRRGLKESQTRKANRRQIRQAHEKPSVKTEPSSSEEEGSDSDDPHDRMTSLEQIAFNHRGICNRVKCANSKILSCGFPLAASWSDVGNIYIWDLHSPLLEMTDTFSRIGQLSIVDRPFIKTRNLPLYVHDEHEAEGYALDWSPFMNGSLLSGDTKGIIRWLIMRTDNSWQDSDIVYKWHKKSVEDVQWSPCEATVFASASIDRSIAIWDTRLGPHCQLYIANAHASDVNVISWNKLDQYLIASGGDDGSVCVWDMRSMTTPCSRPTESAVLPNKASNEIMRIDGYSSKTKAASFVYHKKPITSIEWSSHDSSVIAAASEDGEVTLWDLAAEAVIQDPIKQEVDDSWTERVRPKVKRDIPAQLMFNHGGLVDTKEVHWHPSLNGLVGATSYQGLCLFKTVNV